MREWRGEDAQATGEEQSPLQPILETALASMISESTKEEGIIYPCSQHHIPDKISKYICNISSFQLKAIWKKPAGYLCK